MKYVKYVKEEEKVVEEFYDEECNYFDSTIEDLKTELKKEVKQEIQDKITKLEKENKELQNVKKDWEQLKREYDGKIDEVEREKAKVLANAKQEIYNATLQELFENCTYFSKIYRVNYKAESREKCSECDEDRNLTLTDCFGRKHKVDCKCKTRKKIYYAEKDCDISIYVQKGKGRDSFCFEIRSEDSYEYGRRIRREDILEEFDKNKVKGSWSTYFTTLEEAQKYADYLNKKEELEL